MSKRHLWVFVRLSLAKTRLHRRDICTALGAKRLKGFVESVVMNTFGRLSKEYVVLKAAKALLPDKLFIEQCVAM